jgi:subtilisin family serine protease
MKKIYFKRFLLSAAAVIFTLSANAQTFYQDYVDGMVWVKLKPTALMHQSINLGGESTTDFHNLTLKDAPFLTDLAKQVYFSKIERPFHHVSDEGLNRIFRLTFDDATQVDHVIDELSRNNTIEYAERVELLKTTYTPNDPDYNPGDQWSLSQINAGNAWNLSQGSANIVVAIVDDAVEITHSDLSASIWSNSGEVNGNGIDDDGNGYIDDVNGYDVADMDTDPNPDAPISSYDHGTHVAGIAGATTDNSAGIASIGFGVSLMAVKSTNSASAVTHGYDGVVYAVSSGAHVINMSWGGSGSSTTGQSIIDYAYNNNIVCIAAAGNDNVSSTFYPAGYNNVISVASSTYGDAKSSFSNYGSWIDITAPGSGIWSTIPGNGYAIKQGTSMASPLVAGLCGLMLSLNPGLLPADVENCLLTTAHDIDGANPSYIGELGAGRIDAFAAMNCIAGTQNLAPVAEFTADITSIIEGQSVNFTDLSYYSPDSWSWSFTGGTPSTFNGATPPAITYNTAGTYAVELTVTNTNGSDTETKTGYITVNGVNGCDTIDNIEAGDLNYTYSYNGGGGYLNGHNNVNYEQWADKFTGYGGAGKALTGATFFFTQGETQSTSSVLTVYVWDANGTGGSPGTVLHTEDIPMTDIEFNVNDPGPGSFYPTNVNFGVHVPVTNADFFVGFDVSSSPTTDSVALAVCENFGTGGTYNATRPNTLWVDISGNWWDYSVLSSDASKFSSHVYPRITDAAVTPAVTSNSPICDGDFLNLDASGSTNAVSYEWNIYGTNTLYHTGATPSVIMDTVGTFYNLYQLTNYCGFSLLDSIQVTVDATPAVSITSTADTICPGGSVDLVASGATSYAWNPGGLTGASQTGLMPSVTTTYTVTGTTGACSGDSYVTVIVDDNPPVALYVVNNDTICEGMAMSANAGISTNAATYSWNFTGGDISTSTLPNPSVIYATAGTYPFDVTVENTCSQTDNATGSVIVVTMEDCPLAGIEEGNGEIGTVSYLDQLNEKIFVQFGSTINGIVNFELVSLTGQIVYTSSTTEVTENAIFEIPTTGLQPAVYMLRISSENKQAVEKFFIK